MKTTTLHISGLDCPSEEKLIRNALKHLSEIKQLTFNFIAQELTVKHDITDIQPIIQAIRAVGLQVTLKTTSSPKPILPPQPSWCLLGIAGLFALLAECIGLALQQEQTWSVISLSVLAMVCSGKTTFLKGLQALRTMTLNIHFLMMAAITGAIAIGEWPEAAMVTVLFALAERIESYSLDKARQAIKGLMAITPETATVRTDEDAWQIKPVKDIELSSIIWVKPGERIPLDGIVTSGQSYVNQAPITGESLPVEKKIGDTVYAGSINERGSFEFEATAHPKDTLIAKIIQAVQHAQTERAPTQRFVDTFAHYYTPSMVILAILIAVFPPLVWHLPFYPWLYKALMLLVIACPCALVISTPVTVVSGLAAAAKHGILIKGGTYLEQSYKLKAIAFDKTGTLTQGKPSITRLIALNDCSEQQILHLAASLDSHSEHPVATAIVQAWHQTYPKDSLSVVTEFEAITGRGVTGIIEGKRYYVGNHQLAGDNQVCSTNVENLLEELERTGNTTIILSTEHQALGILAVADTIRAHSQEALKMLHDLGIKTIMMTGDNLLTAQAIAKQVGIDEVGANLLPTDKLMYVNKLLTRYHKVGMVGDGMNDAPALAKATVGFAMGKGTDTALETADVALIDDNLIKLPFFIRLSQRTATVLMQNISLAIGIKVIFFGLAIFGLSTLWMAVFADMGASLIVVANGLRLLRFQ